MADVYGRLTGRAGVYLDRAPLVALTGQGSLDRRHKESHQYLDIVSLMRPITKWNAQVNDPAVIPEVVRKAFKVAEMEKPGATHIELPEDIMAAQVSAQPLPHGQPVQPHASDQELLMAVDLIVLPIDYSLDITMAGELGQAIVAT
jgi:acetolactate synthase-1/2/3 large subunit